MMSEQRLQKFPTDDIHYPDMASASDWLKEISLATRPIRSTTQIWVVTCHQFGITAVIAQMSFCRESSGASRNIGFFLRPIEESRTKELPGCSIPYLLVAYNTLARQLTFLSAHFSFF